MADMPKNEKQKTCEHHYNRPECRLDETQIKLNALYAKQGRSRQFNNQAARDKYLSDEIKALRAFEKSQEKQLQALEKEVENARNQLEEAVARSQEHAQAEEERRASIKKLAEDSARLKKEQDEMQEERKYDIPN
jgi:structural maintenance of chromosome 3 (chondroitin sulfate proteoglycan 6)